MTSKKLVAASSEPIVLGILAGGENYGYSILQRVRSLSGGDLEWTEGMLYPVLHRLERAGLVNARWGTSEHGRQRRYYVLSTAGKKALAKERAEWRAVNATLDRLWGGAHV